MSWPVVTLSSMCSVITKGTTPTTVGHNFANTGIPFLRAENIEGRSIRFGERDLYIDSNTHDALKRSQIKAGDLLLSIAGTIGRAGIVPESLEAANCNQAVAIIRPTPKLNKRFLLHWLSSRDALSQIQKGKVTATISNLSLGQIGAFQVPLPPLPEQRRIVAILDQADALRRLRRQSLSRLSDLGQAIFFEMFGHPRVNPRGLPSCNLGQIARFGSGGTPTKSVTEFWDGDFPWVSPKDMKSVRITDAQDHISESAFERSTLKKVAAGTVLIVVRGMILAHTVPIGMAMREVAINQDMKSLHLDHRMLPEFALWCLLVQHDDILSKVDTAAHGTKRLNTESLGALPMVMPDLKLQHEFASKVNAAEQMMVESKEHLARSESLFASLQHRAFRGDL